MQSCNRCHEFLPSRSVLGTSLRGTVLRSTRPGELGGDPAWGWRGENIQRRTDGDCEKAKCNINETYERRKRRKATKVESLGCYSEQPKLTTLVAGSTTSDI